jgi:FemAB-related protein (PEP-CTERM system-associated)
MSTIATLRADAVTAPRVADEAAAPLTVTEEVTEAEWDGFVRDQTDGTVDHLWRWQRIFSDVFGCDSTYVAARRGSTVVGVLPLVRFKSWLFGRSIVSVPFLNYGGLLASEPHAVRLLIERAREVAQGFGASHVELRHVVRQAPELPYRQHKVSLTRALPGSGDELWATLDKKVRNQVRKARKDGLVAETGGAELVDDFYAVFSTNMRDLGTPVYSKRLFAETLRAFRADARVYVVRSGARPVAASIALRHRDTVLVPWASSLREYRPQCPNMLLYWTMLEAAVKDDVRVFDFGRSSPGSGTRHFKIQWGGEERPLYWEYVLLTSAEPPDHGPTNPRMQYAIAAWKKMPVWLTRVVGPAVVKSIP